MIQDLTRTIEIGPDQGKQQEKERHKTDEEVERDGGGMIKPAITVKLS
jgi:hypothetical protein